MSRTYETKEKKVPVIASTIEGDYKRFDSIDKAAKFFNAEKKTIADCIDYGYQLYSIADKEGYFIDEDLNTGGE